VYVASGMCVAGSVCHQWVCHELSHQRWVAAVVAVSVLQRRVLAPWV
jgi:hypothetical protein